MFPVLVLLPLGTNPLQFPWDSHSSVHSCPPDEFLDEFGGSPQGELNFSFGAGEEYELSIAALEGGLAPLEAEDSPEPPPSGVTSDDSV